MSELRQKYSDLIEMLNEKISNKKDLGEIKESVNTLVTLFMDQIDKIMDISEEQVKALVNRQKDLEDRIVKVETAAKKIEQEMYLDDPYDFEIVCPYCNNEFVADFDESEEEIRCPECNNLIELDWDAEDEAHSCGCSHCDSHCEKEDEDNEDEDM